MSRTRSSDPVRRLHAAPAPRRRRLGRGQSLVEFALVLPVTMLIILAGLDFGRVFLGWIELHTMARVAANFAAENPEAWNSRFPDAAAKAEYERELRAQAAGINCTLPSALPLPVFPNGANGTNNIGTPVTVSVTCSFGLITPVISAILANPLPVTASAAFPIRSGAILGMPTPTPYAWWLDDDHDHSHDPGATPTPAPTPTPEPTPAPTPTPEPTPTAVGATPTPVPTASPSPTPTPPPMCTVPNLVGWSLADAPYGWGPDKLDNKGRIDIAGAHFTQALIFNPIPGKNDRGSIAAQSLFPGQGLPCISTAMTVTWQPK